MTLDDPPLEERAGDGVDGAIKALFRHNEGGVDTHEFAHALEARLTPIKRRRPRPKRRYALVAFATALVAAVGIGAWQGLERLDGAPAELHFGEETDAGSGPATTGATTVTSMVWSTGTAAPSNSSTNGVTTGGDDFSFETPVMAEEFKFEDVWQEVARHFSIDPAAARLDRLTVRWSPDGRLITFGVDASTPDAKSVSVNGYVPMDDQDGNRSRLKVKAHFGRLVAGFPWATTMPVCMTDQVLLAIDRAGLMAIGERSGLDLTGDPQEVLDAYLSSIRRLPQSEWPENAGGEQPLADVGVGTVRWSLTWHSQWVTDAAELTQMPDAGMPKPSVLAISDGQLSQVDDSAHLAALMPAAKLELTPEWVLVDRDSGVERGARTGPGRTYVILPEVAAVAPEAVAQPVDSALDGLAFTTADGTVYRVSNGAIETVWEGEDRFHAFIGAFGVAYTASRSSLLYAGSLIDVSFDGSGESFEVLCVGGPDVTAGSGGSGRDQENSWTYESRGQAALMAVPATGPGAAREILRHEALPGLNNVAYHEELDTVWFSYYLGDGQTTLWQVRPHDAKPERIDLSYDFGGDFAVSPDGSTIVYVGTRQTPTVGLRVGEADTLFDCDLVTAYMPVFSPDGSKFCLVGSASAGGLTSLWLYDLAEGRWTKLAATEGLTPTYPAFSSDGRRIAFRNWALRDIWSIDLESDRLHRYDLMVAAAPIAW